MRLLGPVMLTATGRPAGRRSATPTQQIPASFSSRSVANPRTRASATALLGDALRGGDFGALRDRTTAFVATCEQVTT